MKKGILIRADGSMQWRYPENKKSFTLEELQGFVGGYIELVRLPVKVMKDPKVAIRLARRRYARLAGFFQSAGRTVAWYREYLMIQQPIGVLVIDCMAGTRESLHSEKEFQAWKKRTGGNP